MKLSHLNITLKTKFTETLILMLTFSSHVQIMRITNVDAVVMGVSNFTISYYFRKPCSIISKLRPIDPDDNFNEMA